METAVADPELPATWPEVKAYMQRHYQFGTNQDKDYRLGQAYFNALYEIYPEVADLIRGTPADPFYAQVFTDRRFELFFDTIIPYFQ